MADASELIMKRNNLTNQDVDWLVPHQANKRIIDATASRMNLEESKVLMNIEKYGNTSATLPLVLYDFEHLFKRRYNYSGCFWRFHVGFCLFKMGVRQKIIVN
jgi:3-oxoacyl-[acyl-carrier-protein] synthase-3